MVISPFSSLLIKHARKASATRMITVSAMPPNHPASMPSTEPATNGDFDGEVLAETEDYRQSHGERRQEETVLDSYKGTEHRNGYVQERETVDKQVSSLSLHAQKYTEIPFVAKKYPFSGFLTREDAALGSFF